MQYPLGGNICCSNGELKKINGNEFSHLASTNYGSSGSPIFLKDGIRVLGIHKQRKKDNTENYGDFIKPIFTYIKNNMKFKMLYNNNIYYMDEINNNIPNGKGVEYYKNGNIKYEGEFIDGKFDGNGKYFWEDGSYYIGQFKNNVKHGKGIEYY